ncbi:MAG: branched-chain amino acid ABC transporter substrate-binding protein [Euzebya sp.]
MRHHIVVLLAVLAVLATACGGGDGGTDTASSTAAPEPADTATEAATPTETTATASETDAAASPSASATADGAATDCSGAIGVMGPFTGDAASIGQEQLNWATFAIDRFNTDNGTDFTLVEGDTQLDPAQATTVAQQFDSDDSIVAIVGPAGSQEVQAIGPVLAGGIAFVSPSATSTDLTDGSIPGFFRVVPRDDVQGPTDANFMVSELSAASVLVIDDQTSYSTGLAEAAVQTLEDEGVTVATDSVNQDQTDFSSLVSAVGDDVDVIFLPWQIAANAQIFAQQLTEQGKEATVFGSDGLFSPDDFTAEGAYVSSFAPDIRGIPEDEELVSAYSEEFGDFGTFGPPVYAAMQAVLTAATTACGDGELTREAVLTALPDTSIDDSILGGTLSFDENGDVEGADFFIFQIQDGEYTLVQ